MARTRKAEPVWEWEFDLANWPHGTFFGRRWLEFHYYVLVEPPNGCIYFWTCVWATIAWAFSKVFAVIKAPFLFLSRLSRNKRAAKRPKAVPQPSEQPTYMVPPKVAVRAYEQHRVRMEKQTPLVLRFVGRYILHPVFLGRYSPFRLLGRGLLAVLVAVLDFLEPLVEDFGPPLLIIAVVGPVITLIVILFIENPIIMAIIVGSFLTIAVLATLLVIFVRSEFGKVVIGMAVATKDRLCPGIKVIDTRSGSSTSAA